RREYVHVGSVAPSMALTPPQPDPPRHPTVCPLLLLLLPLPSIRRVQGAALPNPQPEQPVLRQVSSFR
ncbi:hypothetical protein Q0S99_19765, partial [Stenotrophomonas indicatrix]|uniref:hypothetical protein n=1 Tax=Stenotrophomonas indicatrix TaxID=2045451 RepID=UPI0026520F50